jgi:hypothetical protein
LTPPISAGRVGVPMNLSSLNDRVSHILTRALPAPTVVGEICGTGPPGGTANARDAIATCVAFSPGVTGG